MKYIFRSDRTRSIRAGAGVLYTKVAELPPNAPFIGNEIVTLNTSVIGLSIAGDKWLVGDNGYAVAVTHLGIVQGTVTQIEDTAPQEDVLKITVTYADGHTEDFYKR